jgi:hypothetical protein
VLECESSLTTQAKPKGPAGGSSKNHGV